MTISRIEVNEYQCVLCEYKWINRVNGKDGPVPERCAKCKRYGWNGRKRDAITPKESGLRRRIRGLERVYKISMWRMTYPMKTKFDAFSIEDYWDSKLVEKFLNLKPQLTVEELNDVLYPPGLVLGLTSQNFIRREGWVPNPDKPGWMKRDKSPYKEYLKMIRHDIQKQQGAIKKIIEKRTAIAKKISDG